MSRSRAWYPHALAQWLVANQVTVAALTDALILLVIGLVLARAARFARVLGTGARPHQMAYNPTVRVGETV